MWKYHVDAWASRAKQMEVNFVLKIPEIVSFRLISNPIEYVWICRGKSATEFAGEFYDGTYELTYCSQHE